MAVNVFDVLLRNTAMRGYTIVYVTFDGLSRRSICDIVCSFYNDCKNDSSLVYVSKLQGYGVIMTKTCFNYDKIDSIAWEDFFRTKLWNPPNRLEERETLEDFMSKLKI
jgi:hypothetical protein